MTFATEKASLSGGTTDHTACDPQVPWLPSYFRQSNITYFSNILCMFCLSMPAADRSSKSAPGK